MASDKGYQAKGKTEAVSGVTVSVCTMGGCLL